MLTSMSGMQLYYNLLPPVLLACPGDWVCVSQCVSSVCLSVCLSAHDHGLGVLSGCAVALDAYRTCDTAHAPSLGGPAMTPSWLRAGTPKLVTWQATKEPLEPLAEAGKGDQRLHFVRVWEITACSLRYSMNFWACCNSIRGESQDLREQPGISYILTTHSSICRQDEAWRLGYLLMGTPKYK